MEDQKLRTKMVNKKSCENCISFLAYQLTHCKSDMYPCKNYNRWSRNPRLWLSILPTEPGWYWLRKDFRTEPMTIHISDVKHLKLTTKIIGEWQGPIRPEEK